MSHEDQVYELKTAEFAADGEECIRRDDAARIARAADAEIAALRAENERLNRLAWDYHGTLSRRVSRPPTWHSATCIRSPSEWLFT